MTIVLSLSLELIIFILPAWFANAAPAFFSKFLPFRHPIDFGRNFIDGKRILGDGKTLEGFICGVVIGFISGYILSIYGLHNLKGALALALGSMIGDSLGSFIKRRLKYRRGQHAWFLDELPFIITALIFFHFFNDKIILPVNAYPLMVIIILTFIAHNLTNFAYKQIIKMFS
ncbi:MAG: hypothetical protein B6U95_02190 [Thermofilum sp. ex4484_82]|nr:MAG: hypothetical protein B6U95_02190 [Thermofilum sp. ex4484_82]OYT39378.1 MAG: hypothetical protein B6U96_02190 [Archaeoglobales archaeon ex4484_92]